MQGNFLISLDEGTGVSVRLLRLATWLVRITLAAAFASAIADRLGLWGPPGSAGVTWGSLERFSVYVAKLSWFLPPSFVLVVGWTATVAEAALALAFLIGWQLRWAALLAALLLLLFGLTMAIAVGPKAPLDYSIFTAASAAFMLFAIQPRKHSREISEMPAGKSLRR